MEKKKQDVWAALSRFLGSFVKFQSPLHPRRSTARLAAPTGPLTPPATPPALIGCAQGAAQGARRPARPSPPPALEHAPCPVRLHAPRRPKPARRSGRRPPCPIPLPPRRLHRGFGPSLAFSRGRCLLRTDFLCTYLVLLAIGRFLCLTSPKVNKLSY